jgi:hypothetical protein
MKDNCMDSASSKHGGYCELRQLFDMRNYTEETNMEYMIIKEIR